MNSKVIINGNVDCKGTISAELDEFITKMDDHEIFQNNYFKHLTSTSWTPESYILFRDNFFYRTELTVKGIAHVCSRSAFENDMDTLVLFTHILSEETGMGEKAKCHEIFMENALNVFGAAEYNLPEMKVQQAKNSHRIIAETLQYRDTIQGLITGSYPRMLGAVMALENHADKMLTVFREAFRFNNKNLDPNEFVKKVEVYFNAHIENGVEDRHAQDAKQCVHNNCNDQEDLDEIKFGANETLKAQLKMWNAMFNQAVSL
ncbi:iron-containing redox enzyme family protein [Acinetobacter oleivorans]|uniref:iron-containing redox enzyme family protein n=2 Tax=Acinetobacter oleivorans TaxID=1148157 RepID=UPI003A88EB52